MLSTLAGAYSCLCASTSRYFVFTFFCVSTSVWELTEALCRFESVCFTLSIASNNHLSTPKCKICFRLWSVRWGEFTVVELFEQTRARMRTHWLILIKFLSFACLQLCYKNRGPSGLWDSLKQDQNIKNKICQESTGTRISPVKLSVMLFETRCPAQTTSVYFDTVLCNLVGCKYWCCSASSELQNKTKKSLLDVLQWIHSCLPVLSPSGDCFIIGKLKEVGCSASCQ